MLDAADLMETEDALFRDLFDVGQRRTTRVKDQVFPKIEPTTATTALATATNATSLTAATTTAIATAAYQGAQPSTQ